MRSVLPIVLVALLLSVSSATAIRVSSGGEWKSTKTTDCGQYLTCHDCTFDPSTEACGWCDNKCFNGKASGPTTGSCNNTHWHWEGATCPTGPPTPVPPPSPPPSQCGFSTSCEDCSASGECGWCNNACHEGTASGPSRSGVCDNKKWYHGAFDCPADCAAKGTSCITCATDGKCGWCASTNKCEEGNLFGPTHNKTCAAGKWHHAGYNCPFPTPPPAPEDCEQYTSMGCTTCTEMPRCGWCATGVTEPPQPPRKKGPVRKTEKGFTTVDCAQYESCHDCTFDPSSEACGWCDNKCFNGNSSGPTTGTCNNTHWHWEGAHCPTGPPTPAPPPVSMCMNGNATGPAGAPCRGKWDFGAFSCPFARQASRTSNRQKKLH